MNSDFVVIIDKSTTRQLLTVIRYPTVPGLFFKENIISIQSQNYGDIFYIELNELTVTYSYIFI